MKYKENELKKLLDLKLLILGAVVLFGGLGVMCNNIHLEDDDDNEQ